MNSIDELLYEYMQNIKYVSETTICFLNILRIRMQYLV